MERLYASAVQALLSAHEEATNELQQAHREAILSCLYETFQHWWTQQEGKMECRSHSLNLSSLTFPAAMSVFDGKLESCLARRGINLLDPMACPLQSGPCSSLEGAFRMLGCRTSEETTAPANPLVVPTKVLQTTISGSTGERLLDTHFNCFWKDYTRAVEDAVFDFLYVPLVGLPSLVQLERHERLILCMQRDLFIREGIGLFVEYAFRNECLDDCDFSQRQTAWQCRSKSKMEAEEAQVDPTPPPAPLSTEEIQADLTVEPIKRLSTATRVKRFLAEDPVERRERIRNDQLTAQAVRRERRQRLYSTSEIDIEGAETQAISVVVKPAAFSSKVIELPAIHSGERKAKEFIRKYSYTRLHAIENKSYIIKQRSSFSKPPTRVSKEQLVAIDSADFYS